MVAVLRFNLITWLKSSFSTSTRENPKCMLAVVFKYFLSIWYSLVLAFKQVCMFIYLFVYLFIYYLKKFFLWLSSVWQSVRSSCWQYITEISQRITYAVHPVFDFFQFQFQFQWSCHAISQTIRQYTQTFYRAICNHLQLIHLISPGPSIALHVQNRGLKHHSLHSFSCSVMRSALVALRFCGGWHYCDKGFCGYCTRGNIWLCLAFLSWLLALHWIVLVCGVKFATQEVITGVDCSVTTFR